jgi:hypothetical protein
MVLDINSNVVNGDESTFTQNKKGSIKEEVNSEKTELDGKKGDDNET